MTDPDVVMLQVLNMMNLAAMMMIRYKKMDDVVAMNMAAVMIA
jgi:hypothetical protein